MWGMRWATAVLLDKGVDEGTIQIFIGSATPSLDLSPLSALPHSCSQVLLDKGVDESKILFLR